MQWSSASFERILCGIIAAAAIKEGARRSRNGEPQASFHVNDVLDVYWFASHGTERPRPIADSRVGVRGCEACPFVATQLIHGSHLCARCAREAKRLERQR